MKNLPCLLLIVLFVTVGCSLFSDDKAQTNSVANSENAASPANKSSQANTGPTVVDERDFTEDDYVGRWKTSSDFSDHFIEFREDGTGTITLKDGEPKNQAKQNFTWKYEAKHAVFTVKSPVVNAKFIDSGTLTIHAKIIEDGKKLKTDFSTFTRSKGEDVFERQ